MKVSLFVKFLFLTSLFGAVSCNESSSRGDSKKEKFHVTLIAGEGGIDDQGFNQDSWRGLRKLGNEDPNISVNYYEAQVEGDSLSLLQDAVDQGASLVFGIGTGFLPVVSEFAKEKRDVKFIVFDAENHENVSNLLGVTFRIEETAYLAGYIAGKLTKTGKLGFIGAHTSQNITRFRDGFLEGITRANKDTNKNVKLIERYTGSYIDVSKAKMIAHTMVASGVDILFPVTGGASYGAIELAQEKGVYLIGVDSDQSHLAPDLMITSVMKNLGDVVQNLVKESFYKDWSYGHKELGLVDDAVGLAPLNKNIVTDAELVKEVESLRNEIVSGKLNIKLQGNVE